MTDRDAKKYEKRHGKKNESSLKNNAALLERCLSVCKEVCVSFFIHMLFITITFWASQWQLVVKKKKKKAIGQIIITKITAEIYHGYKSSSIYVLLWMHAFLRSRGFSFCGISVWFYALLFSLFCVHFLCAFLPPLGRPHAPSVSDWVTIHY